MSNVKRVAITGILPFNAHEHEGMSKLLAVTNTPSFGLRMQYQECPEELEPNAHGGMTAMYSFTLQGEEAVSWKWLEYFKAQVIACGGRISDDSRVLDIEA